MTHGKCLRKSWRGIALQAMLLYLLYSEGVAPGYSDAAFQAYGSIETGTFDPLPNSACRVSKVPVPNAPLAFTQVNELCAPSDYYSLSLRRLHSAKLAFYILSLTD